MNNELFETIDPTEEALKNTPEEEAFRLASEIFPIRANTLKKPPEIIQVKEMRFKKNKLIELAHFVNSELSESSIIEYVQSICEDYITKPIESDNIHEIWFDSDGVLKFLKWCEPREKDLFNQ